MACPDKWRSRISPAVLWWFNSDPYPNLNVPPHTPPHTPPHPTPTPAPDHPLFRLVPYSRGPFPYFLLPPSPLASLPFPFLPRHSGVLGLPPPPQPCSPVFASPFPLRPFFGSSPTGRGLNLRGRVFGSDFGAPVWDELLAATPPAAPLSSTEPRCSWAEGLEAEQARATEPPAALRVEWRGGREVMFFLCVLFVAFLAKNHLKKRPFAWRVFVIFFWGGWRWAPETVCKGVPFGKALASHTFLEVGAPQHGFRLGCWLPKRVLNKKSHPKKAKQQAWAFCQSNQVRGFPIKRRIHPLGRERWSFLNACFGSFLNAVLLKCM